MNDMSYDNNHWSISRWYFQNKETIEEIGIKEDDILTPEVKEYILENKDTIISNLDRVYAVILPIIRHLEILEAPYLIPFRSKITELAPLDKILSKATYVCCRDSLWYLPSLVKREDFQERVEDFAKHIANDVYALYFYIIYIKKYNSDEVYERFISEFKNSSSVISHIEIEKTINKALLELDEAYIMRIYDEQLERLRLERKALKENLFG